MQYNSEIQNSFYRAKLKGAKFFSIGKSFLGRDILCCHIGSMQGKQILVHGAIHAREYITTLLINRQIEYLLAKQKRGNLDLQVGGIYFIPMVNPDGVDIVFNGAENINCKLIKERVNKILEKSNKQLFKANANLVDINVNFDAKWGEGKHNKTVEGTENYIGAFCESENETKVLKTFTQKIKPSATVSYHSKGEVIYYKFKSDSLTLKEARSLAKLASAVTGYKIVSQGSSSGGFKDYCMEKLSIPSLTIEVGRDDLTHPLSKKDLPHILQQNLKLPLRILEKVLSL